MNKFAIGMVVLMTLGVLIYFSVDRINQHVDEASAEVIERILAKNTISQLRLLTEVGNQIESGDISGAKTALDDAVETYVYILGQCPLVDCQEAIKTYSNQGI